MDFVFHSLTGLIISKEIADKYLVGAFLFSVLPDIGAIPYKYIKFKTSSKKSFTKFVKDFSLPNKRGRFYNDLDKTAYRSTHSLFSLIPMGLLAFVISRQYWIIFSICYLFHLFIDAFTHEKEFSLRLFYPLSTWSIEGKDWSVNKKIFILFWLLLISVFTIQLINY